MAYTLRANEFNSTPFSSCCGIASMNFKGRPDDHCHRCGEAMTHDDDGLAARRREVGPGNCLMCARPRSECYC